MTSHEQISPALSTCAAFIKTMSEPRSGTSRCAKTVTSEFGPKLPNSKGGVHPLRPLNSDVNLFRYRERVVDFNPEIPDRALDFCMTQQELNSA